MKKMQYAVIFIIVLAILVFAGCVKFVGPETDETENSTSESVTASPVYADETTENGVIPTNPDGTPETTLPDGTGTEATTGSSGGITQNGDAPNSVDPTSAQTNTGSNEYEILRSGTFYMKGSMIDSSGTKTPMDMAITPTSVYALSQFDGVDMGVLVSNGKTYLLYPEKNAYMEMSSTVMSLMGMSSEDLLDVSDLGFEGFRPLSEATTVTDETVNGITCKCYTFVNSSNESAKVYLNGTKLVRFATTNSSGVISSASDVDYISADVPADKIDPSSSSLKKTGLIEFMKLLSDVIKVD